MAQVRRASDSWSLTAAVSWRSSRVDLGPAASNPDRGLGMSKRPRPRAKANNTMKRDQAIRDLFAVSELEPELVATARWRASRPIHISGYHREANDFYATPDWVTEALLSYVQFRGRVWEPRRNLH
jgi:hypothetical protein